MIIRHYLKAHFVQKQTEVIFPVFDQNHGFASLKISICNVICVKSIFFSLGSLVFYLNGQQALFQGPFCLKTSEGENSNF